MHNDRRFKESLQRFLPSFLRIFLPEQARRFDFSTLTFLESTSAHRNGGDYATIS
jgi:hypothetical protein